MKRGIPKLYFLIPILYAAVIFSLIYLQLSQKKTFHETSAGFSISGVTGTSGIEELTVSSDTITFPFTKQNKLIEQEITKKYSARVIENFISAYWFKPEKGGYEVTKRRFDKCAASQC